MEDTKKDYIDHYVRTLGTATMLQFWNVMELVKYFSQEEVMVQNDGLNICYRKKEVMGTSRVAVTVWALPSVLRR